jgi:hypothetical protein
MSYGGLLKTASAVAIFAAAGLYGTTAANAADLGGDCCADLEERVAELEATAVRKGNRKVSLAISGFVGQQVLYWNDGTQKDVYVGDSGNLTSRFRFSGAAKISRDVTAGFLYEFAALANATSAGNQLNGADDLGPSGAGQNATLAYAGCGQNNQNGGTVGCATVRQQTAWLKHEQLGKIQIGQGSTATDAITSIDLGGMGAAYNTDHGLYNAGFILRSNAGLLSGSGATAGLNWANASRGHDAFLTSRRNHVLYETPTLAGFTVQAAVAEDNYWDVALRYAGEFSGIRIAGAIGYLEDTKFNGGFQLFNQAGALCVTNCDVKSEELKGSLSLMHVPTGIFVSGGAGERELSGSNTAGTGAYVGPNARFWSVAGGISQNYFGIGKTVLFGEYSEHKGGLAQQQFLAAGTQHCYNATGCDSTVSQWGLGVNQYIDAAAMELFATYKNYSLESSGFTANGGSSSLNKGGSGVSDMSMFIVGTRIQF